MLRFLLLLIALSATACEMLNPPGGIAKAVIAPSVKPDTFEAVNVNDNYPPDQAEIHAVVTLTNAPQASVVKVVWIAADVGAALPPDSKLFESEMRGEGSRNVDFVLKRSGRQFAPGLYKAQVYWNGKLDRTLNFVVVGTPQAAATTKPAGTCPPATTQPHKVTGLITQVILAEGAGANNEPVNRTGEFLAKETIHAIVTSANAPANTKFRAVFYAVDADGSKQCNVKLGETEQLVTGAKHLDFALKPTKDWALGTYRVDIYVNDVLDHTANYVVVTQKQVH